MPVTGLVAHAALSEMTAAKRKQVPFVAQACATPVPANSGPFRGPPTADRPVLETSSSPSGQCGKPCRPAAQDPHRSRCCSFAGDTSALPHHRHPAERSPHSASTGARLATAGTTTPNARGPSQTLDGCARGAPIGLAAPPLRRRPALREARRLVTPTSCGDTSAAPSSLRAARRQSRSCGTPPSVRARAAKRRSATCPTARRGTSGCSCRRRRVPIRLHRAACRRAK